MRYLERIIGSAINNLTNKSKIQNYLGDYQKSEPHLSCDQLWEILKKNKKKITVNLLDRQIQETLEKEYQTSLDKLLPLKQQLSATDELIDIIVYKLYGLIILGNSSGRKRTRSIVRLKVCNRKDQDNFNPRRMEGESRDNASESAFTSRS